MRIHGVDRTSTRALSVRALAVHGPLLLFTSGILRWVDGIPGRPGDGALWVSAQVLLGSGLVCLAAVAVLVARDRSRLGIGSWLLVVAGLGTVALTRELLPLASLLVLIGLAPLGAGATGGLQDGSPAPSDVEVARDGSPEPSPAGLQGIPGSGQD